MIVKKTKFYDKKEQEKLDKMKENKKVIENTFLVFYKSRIFSNRLNYENFFPEKYIKYWEFYLSEIQLALNQISIHERGFLENCYLKRMGHKDMFLSKSSYYRCLKNYSAKFLSFFDYEFFHKTLSDIYNSSNDPSFYLPRKPEEC
ncbi:hypothetical protein [Mycoplasma parvum]|nr:hypothetical protein [Mycoplasma parvum]